jgi:hypothetical protein
MGVTQKRIWATRVPSTGTLVIRAKIASKHDASDLRSPTRRSYASFPESVPTHKGSVLENRLTSRCWLAVEF